MSLLPTYLEGGNGVDNGDVEILTTPVGDFIAYGNNASVLGWVPVTAILTINTA